MNQSQARGSRVFTELTGRVAGQTLEHISLISPHMHDWLLRGAFDQPLADPRLTGRDREVATVAMLAALGDTAAQLRVHVGAALHQGATPEELRALVEHVSVYAGFPRALNALDVVTDVLHGLNVADPLPTELIQLSDHRTQIARLGESGPPVVLLHALGLTWHMWEPIMEALAPGRRVFAYDLRGHGSATEAPTPRDVETLASDLREVLDREGLARAHVVGLSYGGAVAQAFAAEYPDTVLSLVLAATTSVPFAAFEQRALAVETEGLPAQVRSSLTRWFTPEALAENGWGVRYARDRIVRGSEAQVAASWRVFSALDVAGRLGNLRGPTLVLCGERDASTGPDVMKPMVEAIPGSAYLELPGAPHMPTLETPAIFAAALDQFLPREEVPRLAQAPALAAVPSPSPESEH